MTVLVERSGPDQVVRPAAAVRRPVPRPAGRRTGRADRPERGRQVHPPPPAGRPGQPGRWHPHRPPRGPHRVRHPGRRLSRRPDGPRRPPRRPGRRAGRGARARHAGGDRPHPGRVRRPGPAGRCAIRWVAEAAEPGPRAGPPAGLPPARRADQPPRPAGRRLAGAAAAGGQVRLPGGDPRPGVPAGRGRRGPRGQPGLPGRHVPRGRVLRGFPGPPRRVPRSPGPPAGGGRQPGAQGDRVARPVRVGPAAEVEVADRRGGPAARRSWPT